MDKPIFETLSSVTHHVTESSSSIYEADYFNIPSLVYGESAKIIFAKKIANH